MATVFAVIGRLVVRFRWVVLVAWIIGVFAAMSFLPSLSSVTQSDNSSFLPASTPSQQAAQLASPLQKTTLARVTVVVVRPGSTLTPADQAVIGALSQALGKVANVTSVRDAGLSPDGRADQLRALASVRPSGAQASQAQKTLVADMRSAISRVNTAGLQVHLAGPVATSVDNNNATKRTGNSVQTLSLVFVIVLLAVVFRSMMAPVIAVVPAFLVVLTAGRLTAVVAEHGLQVSAIASLLQIVLVLGAGTDYALFLMFRVREGMRGGLPPRDAVAMAVARVGESITFSAGTVIAALLSLLGASFGLYSGLGVPLAIGIGLMLVAGLTLVPALLAIVGEAAFWPSNVGPGPERTGWWGQIAARIVRRPAVTLIIGVVVFGGLAVMSFGYQASGLGGAVTAPAGTDAAVGDALLAAHFPQTAANPTTIVFRLARPAWDDPQALATAQRQLQADPQFTKVTGPLDPNGTALTPARYASLYAALGPPSALTGAPGRPVTSLAEYQAYRASAQLVSADGRTVEYATALAAGDPTTTPAVRAVPAVRADAASTARAIGATASGVVGQAAGTYDIGSLSDSDLRTVIPIAVAVIAVLLALVMRSLVAPLYLIASVALSYFAALGAAVLVFMKLGGQAGMTFILPFLMFVFLLALGEDYNILVMTRIREEAHGLTLREAVTRALSATGTTVTSAGLVLAGTFGVLAIDGGGGPNGNTIVDVGAGLALGILMDTFLVRTLLVPSTVVLLGRWNWWPSRLAGRAAGPAAAPAAAAADGEPAVAAPGRQERNTAASAAERE